MCRQLPDRSWTDNEEKYSEVWVSFGKKALPYFPGYILTACNPTFRFERRETSTRDGRFTVVDSFELSQMAVGCLVTGFEPSKVLREDF